MSNEIIDIIVRFTNIKVLAIYNRDKQIYPNELSSEPQSPQLDHTGRKVVTGSYHRCYKQTIKKRRKTRKSCVLCSKPVFDEHEW